MVPAKGGQKKFKASILLALKALKQNFGCQPQTLEGEEGGGSWGGGGVLLRSTAVPLHHCPSPHLCKQR